MQGANVVALAAARLGRALERLPHRAVGRFGAVIVHRSIVVVRSGGEGDTPVRHCRFRIELCGALEVARGFVVIESVEKRQSLVEVTLRFGAFGRDRVMVVAQSRVQLRDFGRLIAMLVLRCRRGKRKSQNEKRLSSNAFLPSLLFWYRRRFTSSGYSALITGECAARKEGFLTSCEMKTLAFARRRFLSIFKPQCRRPTFKFFD